MRVWWGQDSDLISKQEYETERKKLKDRSRDPPKLLEMLSSEADKEAKPSPVKSWRSPKYDEAQKQKIKEAEEFVRKINEEKWRRRSVLKH